MLELHGINKAYPVGGGKLEVLFRQPFRGLAVTERPRAEGPSMERKHRAQGHSADHGREPDTVYPSPYCPS